MSITKTSLAVLAALAFASPALAQQSGGSGGTGGTTGSDSTGMPKECPAGAPNCVEDPGAPK